jgi:hypothetical protein
MHPLSNKQKNEASLYGLEYLIYFISTSREQHLRITLDCYLVPTAFVRKKNSVIRFVLTYSIIGIIAYRVRLAKCRDLKMI